MKITSLRKQNPTMSCPDEFDVEVPLVHIDEDRWEKYEYLCEMWFEYILEHPFTTKMPPWVEFPKPSKCLEIFDQWSFEDLYYFYY